MELGKGELGSEGMWAFKFEGGKLVAQLMYDGTDMDGEIMIKFEASKIFDAIVDKAEKVIPGDQKALAALLKAYIAGMMK
jgi:hypothetical protein